MFLISRLQMDVHAQRVDQTSASPHCDGSLGITSGKGKFGNVAGGIAAVFAGQSAAAVPEPRHRVADFVVGRDRLVHQMPWSRGR